MIEPAEVAPPAAPGPNENVPPPPPHLQEMPGDLPEMPDESEGTQSGSRPRRNSSARAGRAAATSGERPRAPQTITPRRQVRQASPQSDEPVVYRRTTVELLPPTESEGALLTPPSYPPKK